MRPPRRLSAEEAAIWRQVAQTVKPLDRKPRRQPEPPAPVIKHTPEPAPVAAKATVKLDVTPPLRANVIAPAARPRAADAKIGLDASWERKIVRGGMEPDFSLDLHGSTLDQAYVRLMHGLAQARAMGARVVLIVTGKSRPTEAADRGQARGAIRAKITDWLGASEHAGAIAAIRGAHRRHGGKGALYVVLKRAR
jgi:DNA-nicking Smr family endonuclease